MPKRLSPQTQAAFAAAQAIWPQFWKVNLAHALGVHPSVITRLARGRKSGLRAEHLHRLEWARCGSTCGPSGAPMRG